MEKVTVNQVMAELAAEEDRAEDFVNEYWNCKNGYVDTDGKVWVETPQSGHFVDDEEIEQFCDWLML